MATAQLNFTSIYYDTIGGGPPCLVLHGGLGVDHALYRDLDVLADRVQLVYFDQRHNGRSGRPPLETITMTQLADDAAALADHLGFDTFIVLGHSYGGFVAQELAIRHPDRVNALVLVDTTPGQLGTDEQPGDAQGPPPPTELIELFAAMPTTDEETRLLLRAVAPHYVHRVDPADLADKFDSVICSAAAATRGFEVLAGWSSVDRLQEVQCPSLIAVGRFDVITSRPQAERMARRIPDARVVIFEDSGHMPWIDEPDMFFDTVAAWLDRFALRGHRAKAAASP